MIVALAGPPGKANSIDGTFIITRKAALLPGRLYLLQNYPNPSKYKTTIEFNLPARDHVELSIYTLSGKKLETLVSSELNEGVHRVSWDTRKYSPGLYFYRMKTGNFNQIMKASIR